MYRLSSDLEEFQTTMSNRLEYKSKALIRVQLIYDNYKMTQTVHKKEQVSREKENLTVKSKIKQCNLDNDKLNADVNID